MKLRHTLISILTLLKVTANSAQATYQTFGHRAPYRLAIAQLRPRINTDSERVHDTCGCLRLQVTAHHLYYMAVQEAHRHAPRVVGRGKQAPERSEERRVGKECGRTGRSRWSSRN